MKKNTGMKNRFQQVYLHFSTDEFEPLCYLTVTCNFNYKEPIHMKLQEFFRGGGAKSIVMQISVVMLIFLLFSDQISGGRQKSLRGRPCLPPWKKASEV